MKKKLIQILMLLVAAVSVGSFVSCKDTNEDLYNELRAKSIADDATLEEALRAEIDRLEGLIDAIESCECDEAAMKEYIDGQDDALRALIDALSDGLANNYYTKHEVDDFIKEIKDLYATKEDLGKLAERVAAVEYLKDEVKTLREELDKIKSCECDCATVMTKLGELEGRIIEAEANAKEALDALKATEDLARAAQLAADQAQKIADQAYTMASKADATAEACKTLLETALQNATDAKTAAEAAKTQAENNKTAIENLEKKLDEVETKVNLASENANKALEDAAAAAAKANANKELIDNLTERVAKNETNIENLQKSVEKLENLAEQVGANTEAIKELKEKVKDVQEMKEKLAALEQQVEDCQKICATNLEAAKAEIRLEIETLKTELVDRIATNEETLRLHEKALEQLGALLGSYTKEDLDKFLERLDNLEEADIKLDERLVTAETKLKDLEPRVKKLEGEVKNLTTRIKDAEDKLKEIEPKVETLVGDVAALQDYLKQQVTGIIVQGTYNPMFGSFSIPANIQSNMLVAYYGELTKDVYFPTTKTGNYVRPEEALTAKDKEMLGFSESPLFEAGEYILNGEEDGKAYAGKLYLTVNPTSIDATGLDGLQIVNSQDVVSPFALSPLKKSSTTLQFGFNRADNGFYESDVYVSADQLDAYKVALSEDALKEAINETRDKIADFANNFFKDGTATGDLGNVATKIYNVLHEMRTDQNGVKCPLKDVEGNSQAIYSQYNLAGIVMKPLTLATFKDIHYYTIPGYEDLEKFIHDFISKITGDLNNHVHVVFKDFNESWKVQKLFNGLKIDGVDLVEFLEGKIDHFEGRISGFSLNGTSYTFSLNGSGNAELLFDKAIGGTFDENEMNLNQVTLVITSDLKAVLYIPAKAEGSKIAAYAKVELPNVTIEKDAAGVYTLTGAGHDHKVIAHETGSGITLDESELVLSNFDVRNGTIALPVVNDIAADSQEIVDLLKSLTAELNETLAKINKYENIAAGEDGWINKEQAYIEKFIQKYLNKINNTTVYFFNSVNRRFGPFLTASNNYQGFKTLSTNVLVPTTLNKVGLNLYPTTKNMELFVPIARKHVAVTDVYNEDGKSAQKDGYASLKTALKNANSTEKLNTVLDGTTRIISIDESKLVPGFTYEIAYSVLDFEGNISTAKYYIKIAE